MAFLPDASLENMAYEVKRNACNCRPETCNCNPWVVHRPNGDKHSTYFVHAVAVEVAASLTLAAAEYHKTHPKPRKLASKQVISAS